MDELSRRLAESLHGAAGQAPSDAGLLANVHGRARRYRRQRLATVTAVSAAVAVVAVGIPILTAMPGRSGHATTPAASAPDRPVTSAASASPSESPARARPTGKVSSSPPRPTGGSAPPTLTAGWKAPVFPYTLPVTDGVRTPVASMSDGFPSAFFEAIDEQNHADVTITVLDRRPTFTTAARETATTVRGHAGTLRTVDVSPARQLTLYWKESASRWIQLATDDTYSPEQVVALADSLTGAAVAVQPPFDLELSPAGLVTDTVTASRMVFRSPDATPGAGGFATVLRKRRQLENINRKINGYDAALSRRTGEVTLSIDVTDWDATLVIVVNQGMTVTDADLVRYAEGIRILNRSDPE